MPAAHRVPLLGLLFLSAACTGPSSAGAQSESLLVGTWRLATNPTGSLEYFTFKEDRTFESNVAFIEACAEVPCTETGTYRVEGDSLVLESSIQGGTWTEAETFHVDKKNLVRFAHRREGSGEGIVGTWSHRRTLMRGAMTPRTWEVGHTLLFEQGALTATQRTYLDGVEQKGSGNGSFMGKWTRSDQRITDGFCATAPAEFCAGPWYRIEYPGRGTAPPLKLYDGVALGFPPQIFTRTR